jgi:hypothetical protein
MSSKATRKLPRAHPPRKPPVNRRVLAANNVVAADVADVAVAVVVRADLAAVAKVVAAVVPVVVVAADQAAVRRLQANDLLLS